VSTLDLAVLLPQLTDVHVEAIRDEGGLLRIRARTRQADGAACPECGGHSQRVHSRYERRINDHAVAGRRMVIHLRSRRFFCDTAGCVKVTFAEQVTGLTARHARHSVAARQALTRIASATGGRAGQRLSAHLGLQAGRTTLLRLIRAIDEPATGTPRILGVDDFALRRGHVYATILIDMDTHQPVDVLPDRSSDTLAAWLRAHPGVEIICRDRAGAYAEGATAGAPEAVQVADRFHLWRNLGEAVEKDVITHRGDLHEPAPVDSEPALCPEPAAPDEPAETRLAIRTRERYAAIHQLLTAGVSRAEVSRRLRLDPHTVRRFADATSIDALLVHTRRDTLIDAFKPYLHDRFNQGCTDASRLFTEITAQGFTGSVKTVRRYLQPFRATMTAPPAAPAPPKPRHVTCWIMTKPGNLDPDDRDRLAAIIARSPALQSLAEHVRAFAEMMTGRTGEQHLQGWIDQVLTTDALAGLRSFANGLRRDLAAVTAGLSLPYSSGAVEGQVNRIKMIKRMMFGRAKFDLLRQRILTPA
jgi:transposase